MAQPKYTIDLKVSENEIRHLISIYAKRVEGSNFGSSESEAEYMDWNIKRLIQLYERVRQ